MVSDMKHSPTPIRHNLNAPSFVCAGKLETIEFPRTHLLTSNGPMTSLVCALAINFSNFTY